MGFEAVLGIIAVLAFGYFIYKKVTDKKDSGGTGGGGLPNDNEPPQQER